MLEPLELKRYSRQIILPEIGLSGQLKLKAARVMVIGAGGLGCPVLQYLGAAGIGQIGIIDDDTVDITNLHRQILYSSEDIGLNKAVTASNKLKLLNPHVTIEAYPVRITNDNAEKLLADYDIIVDGSDNFSTRYLVNDTCLCLDKILVSGAIFKYEGQVAVFNYQQGPNYRDLFPDENNSSTSDNCAEVGVLGVLPGIIGAYMAGEVIKIICQIGEVLSGKLLTVNALDCNTYIFKIPSNNTGSKEVKLPVFSQKLVSGLDQTGSEQIASDNITLDQTGSEQIASDQKTSDLIASDQERTPGLDVRNSVSLKELQQWLHEQKDQVMLIDVRENYEFEESNLGGINIPIYELIEHLSEFQHASKVVFYCQSGVRSKLAMQLVKPLFNGLTYMLKKE